jgi:hypothetical protein
VQHDERPDPPGTGGPPSPWPGIVRMVLATVVTILVVLAVAVFQLRGRGDEGH